MTKIKLFAGDDSLELTDRVNEFIADHMVIGIKYQSNISGTDFNFNGTPSNVRCNDRILVVYEV